MNVFIKMKFLTFIMLTMVLNLSNMTLYAITCNNQDTCLLNLPAYIQTNRDHVSEQWFLSDNTTNVCAPTSAAMISQGIANISGLDGPSNPTFADFYNTDSIPAKIDFMATAMRTSRTDGTYIPETGQVYDDFKDAYGLNWHINYFQSGSSYIRISTLVPMCTLQNIFKGTSGNWNNGHAAPFALLYGHYYESTETRNGVKFHSYERRGGHATTVRGYVYNKLRMQDPALGNYDFKVSVLPKRIEEDGVLKEEFSLPYSSQDRVMYIFEKSVNNYIPIIKTFLAVGTK